MHNNPDPKNDAAPLAGGADRVNFHAPGFYGPSVESRVRADLRRIRSFDIDRLIDEALEQRRYSYAYMLGHERDRRLAMFLGPISRMEAR